MNDLKFLMHRMEKLEASVKTGIPFSNNSVSNPPTDVELDTAFGNAADLYNGFTGILDHGGANTRVYLVAVANSTWWWGLLTKAI